MLFCCSVFFFVHIFAALELLELGNSVCDSWGVTRLLSSDIRESYSWLVFGERNSLDLYFNIVRDRSPFRQWIPHSTHFCFFIVTSSQRVHLGLKIHHDIFELSRGARWNSHRRVRSDDFLSMIRCSFPEKSWDFECQHEPPMHGKRCIIFHEPPVACHGLVQLWRIPLSAWGEIWGWPQLNQHLSSRNSLLSQKLLDLRSHLAWKILF